MSSICATHRIWYVSGRFGVHLSQFSIASAVSEVFSPFVLSGLLVTTIAVATAPNWGLPVAISLIFIVGFPLFLSLWLHRTGRVTDRFMRVRKQRTPFYIATLVSFVVGAVALNVIDTSREVPLAINLSVAMLLVVTVVNLKFKVSMHALVAALFALVFPFYFWGMPWGFVLGFGVWISTVWSRVVLKRHSVPEVVVGTLFGVVLGFIYLFNR